jgi:hypothetical protein
MASEQSDPVSQDHFCAICGRPCKLEECVIDELGRAVHRECYDSKIAEQAS